MKRPVLRPLRVASGEMLRLDLLRFIASVGIVLAHSLGFYFPALDARGVARSDRRPGAVRRYFFVISGFVISHITPTGWAPRELMKFFSSAAWVGSCRFTC